MEKIIVIGAGAAGLMAAHEIAKTGRQVTILEARNRIGGRIYPLDEQIFDYPAQGGAEFMHGEMPITQALAKEANVEIVPRIGEVWSKEKGTLSTVSSRIWLPEELRREIEKIETDMSLQEFVERYLNTSELAELRLDILRLAQAYDAADPADASFLTLRDEWLANGMGQQYQIPSGYGRLIRHLQAECEKLRVEIHLGAVVKRVNTTHTPMVICTNGREYEADKVIVTVPVPVVKDIEFDVEVNDKVSAANNIGYGNAMKVLLKFKDRWWQDVNGRNLESMIMLLTDEHFSTWWTQYPDPVPLLTGWAAGPNTKEYKDATDEEVIRVALSSLCNYLDIDQVTVKDKLVNYKVCRWDNDPYSQGAYTYVNLDTQKAKVMLLKPYENKLFFAGEALGSQGREWATVEAALSSGLEVAKRVIG